MEIPSIGFGTYRLLSNTEESVLHALNEGYHHVDTAPLYKNEAQVGSAIANSGIDRRQLFVTTKISRNELLKNKISESIENSLKTMNLDYIDLLLLHEPIDIVTNWKLLCEYQSANKHKILNIGVSNFDEIDLIQVHEFCDNNGYDKIKYNQIEVNPFIQQKSLVDYCKSNNIKIVAHTPLAKGEKNTDLNLNIIAQSYNNTPSQIMLKWAHQNDLVIIPRSSNKSHITENIEAMSRKFSSFSGDLIEKEDMQIMSKLDCSYATHPKYLRKNRK